MTPAAAACEIVPYEARFRDQLVRLREVHHGMDPEWSDADFAWRYETNPYLEGPWIVVAVAGDRVVGMRSLLGARWAVGPLAHRFDAPCLAGTAIERAYRTKGLFERLTRAVEEALRAEGYPYIFNFHPVFATHVASLALGWRGIGALQAVRWDPPGGPSRSASARAMRLAARLSSRLRLRASRVAVEDAPDLEAMATLAAAAPQDARIRHVREAAYLRWRFANPAATYRFLALRRGGRLEGVLVLGQRRRSWRLDIVEWLAPDPADLEPLLAGALRFAASRSMPLAVWPASLSVAAPALFARGFRKVTEPAPLRGYQPSFLVKRLTAAEDAVPWSLHGAAVDRLEGWDLRMAYSDFF